MMLGYATNETEALMPLSHYLASKLCERIMEVMRDGTLPWVHPDAKTQVTVEYETIDRSIRPVRVHTVLISASHSDKVTLK